MITDDIDHKLSMLYHLMPGLVNYVYEHAHTYIYKHRIREYKLGRKWKKGTQYIVDHKVIFVFYHVTSLLCTFGLRGH